MDFDATLFSTVPTGASIDPSQVLMAGANIKRRQSDTIKTDTSKEMYPAPQKQTFYPTPTSANMHADMSEKQFMSPFPANYQPYSPLGEIDDFLFAPMLSPAMTPMQNTHNSQATADIDWEQFDQSLFALTGSAMDAAQLQSYNAENGSIMPEALQTVKKQKVTLDSAKNSCQPSPTTPYTIASNSTNGYHHKRNASARTSTRNSATDREPSLESSDGVSPVDLNQEHSQYVGSGQQAPDVWASGHIQPITPSMLMSLQSVDGTQDTVHSPMLGASNSQTIPTDAQMMPSPAVAMSSTTKHRPGTPRSQATLSGRDFRSRPIAPAHSKSKSVTSSPALGPQRPKPSPDIRPLLPGGMSSQVGAILASKSNYQHIVDGTYEQLNITYPQGMTEGLEVRRSSHKAAEQKRRDHLKECFDSLRTILPDAPEPGASKVAILKKGYEHILQLQARVKEQDELIARLESAAKGEN